MKGKEKIIFCLLLYSLTTYADKNTEQWITIFIHGTVMPYITFFDVLKLKNKEIQPTMLTRMNKLYRKSPFFYQCQPIQGFGLKPIYFAKSHPGNAAQAFGKTFHLLNKKCYPKRRINRYYTFGWSGLLNKNVRDLAAQQLYEELVREINKLKEFNDNPIHIILCCFSHGGNVGLSLYKYVNSKKTPFTIDQLILYGTPIQEESYKGLRSPLYQNVYNLYSLGDRIQKFDFISGSETSRTFEGPNLPKKLKQVRLRFNRRKTPYKLGREYAEKTKKRVYPGHIELWFFGWTQKWYRPHFPLQPFPVAAFTPFITKTVDDLGTTNTMTIEISPKSGQTMVTSYDNSFESKDKKYINSMTKSDLHWLQRKVKAYSPQNYKRTYRSRFNALVRKARQQLRLRS
ncbi:hypothetical protein A3F06_03705 [candidate division TM6 bacterium RIFCSPHIGHO2_12_FULL_36_22]|nr:MAG: hypothetical protein A3F06_03705 [candidate division TM6 bacterium RIFCSPHIGHO2_12_FULL_36_22]